MPARNSDVNGFRASHAAFALAGVADHAKAPAPAATRAGNVESHVATGARLLARASTFGAYLLRFSGGSRAMACGAAIQTRDGDFLYGAANGVPETYFHAIFEVRAGFLAPSPAASPPAAAAKKLAE